MDNNCYIYVTRFFSYSQNWIISMDFAIWFRNYLNQKTEWCVKRLLVGSWHIQFVINANRPLLAWGKGAWFAKILIFAWNALIVMDMNMRWSKFSEKKKQTSQRRMFCFQRICKMKIKKMFRFFKWIFLVLKVFI